MDIRGAIADERVELAALLDGLTEEQWEAPSLCTGWRVREVAAHMSFGFRTGRAQMVRELLRARGRLHRMTDTCARRDAAAMSEAELAAALRDNAHHPWTPPVGGPTAALGHDVVHGLDITVALGHERRVPLERVRLLLEGVTPRSLKFFGADLTGVALRADDLEWSYGGASGMPVRGAAQDLLLVAFGRALPPGRLRGEAADRFSGAFRERPQGESGESPQRP
ncbi:maleylpyruvate isomerase family mycothiol-dependent enzyme [Streptomyces reniochalinae]|uniref:Maleylpyruvate isomerase family mycothiol-dependent enzyme n=1 Tax=Streptomyces reniochalinae TaxID=2250578 RepID=A0A367F1G1_9ACTN|nr:maleylpyruvate isomerase family mycothiol-dependent enzyme [Streptomyces reniochalinae]RCG23320.1 maleylpyruvate isomerase family mycothiol-dependent enzyme [Streptomyces reniochalinae]